MCLGRGCWALDPVVGPMVPVFGRAGRERCGADGSAGDQSTARSWKAGQDGGFPGSRAAASPLLNTPSSLRVSRQLGRAEGALGTRTSPTPPSSIDSSLSSSPPRCLIVG